MAHCITPPRDAIRRPLQNFTNKHSLSSWWFHIQFWGFHFFLWKLQVQLIICMCIQTMAVLKHFYLPSNVWSLSWMYPVAKCGEDTKYIFLHNFMFKYLFCTISWLFIFIDSYVKFLYSLSLCMCSHYSSYSSYGTCIVRWLTVA